MRSCMVLIDSYKIMLSSMFLIDSYKIMLDCWHADPDIRPSFIDLVNRIELLLNPPKKRVSEPEQSNEPMYVNIRKTNSTEYLRPSETPGASSSNNDENV